MPGYPYLSPKEANPHVKAAAQKALELDPTLAVSHVTLAYSLATFDWDWGAAEREFSRAREIEPNNEALHLRYAEVYLMPLGRYEEAIAEFQRAIELEPLSLFNNTMLAAGYFAARQFERAVDQAERTYDLEPNFALGRYAKGLAYNSKGMYAEAIALGEESLQHDPTNQSYLRMAGYAYARMGRRREAEQMIHRFREIAKTEYVISYGIASIYAALGELDLAFAELDKAFAEHDWYLHRLKADPLMDLLCDDPRFVELVKRLGLPQ
jgi:tetratricopeptide (TPR) repeat protein